MAKETSNRDMYSSILKKYAVIALLAALTELSTAGECDSLNELMKNKTLTQFYLVADIPFACISKYCDYAGSQGRCANLCGFA